MRGKRLRDGNYSSFLLKSYYKLLDSHLQRCRSINKQLMIYEMKNEFFAFLLRTRRHVCIKTIPSKISTYKWSVKCSSFLSAYLRCWWLRHFELADELSSANFVLLSSRFPLSSRLSLQKYVCRKFCLSLFIVLSETVFCVPFESFSCYLAILLLFCNLPWAQRRRNQKHW